MVTLGTSLQAQHQIKSALNFTVNDKNYNYKLVMVYGINLKSLRICPCFVLDRLHCRLEGTGRADRKKVLSPFRVRRVFKFSSIIPRSHVKNCCFGIELNSCLM